MVTCGIFPRSTSCSKFHSCAHLFFSDDVNNVSQKGHQIAFFFFRYNLVEMLCIFHGDLQGAAKKYRQKIFLAIFPQRLTI